MSLFSLKDKVIVITGGTGILGGVFVSAVANAGATVVIIGRNKEKLQKKEEEIKHNGGTVMTIACDVMATNELHEAREKIIHTYEKIDGLVNAAGGNVPEAVVQPSDDIFALNIEGMQKAFTLNLWGSVLPTQVFGEAMKHKGGSVVNISSVSSKTVLTRVLGYSMGKSAIDIYTQWFAVEVARRYGDTIRINSITPGFFLTEQNRKLLTNDDGSLTDRGNAIISKTPFNRFGNPGELCGALLWLLSDESKFVTGSTITVDGGFTIYSGV